MHDVKQKGLFLVLHYFWVSICDIEHVTLCTDGRMFLWIISIMLENMIRCYTNLWSL